jgi:energy-coupling factor transporter ATP-binding protein EcfA2
MRRLAKYPSISASAVAARPTRRLRPQCAVANRGNRHGKSRNPDRRTSLQTHSARGRAEPENAASAPKAAGEPRTDELNKKSTLEKRREMSVDELWSNLRQGARNAAGVTWQINACAYLLVASRAGELPFAELTPEGYEDADCAVADGTRTFAQMKELDGGQGEMGPAGLADALAHAEASARGAKIVVLTDGSLGSGLSFTGWASVLSDQSGEGIERIQAGLTRKGYEDATALDILARAHVVRLPYRVRQASEALLAEATGVHPTVAGIAISRLTDALAKAAADQRGTTRQTATRVRTSDLDAIIAEVQDTIDMAGLDQAVAAGVCSPVSFLAAEYVLPRVFYLGVDGRPGHVAADLDVIRPGELLACAEGFGDEGSVLLVGPSGAGKSVLLWRAARDLIPAARVLRVRRVQDDDDARALSRHVGLLRPSSASPVMVVADDLGRPHMTGWPRAAALLREIPSALLLGAARAEDFSPDLLVGATRVIEPTLDTLLADALAARLREQDIALRMDPEEAFERSEGLLMEYAALLTTGQRLRQVLATQVLALQAPSRRIQREAARLVTMAHTLGLTLSADSLGSVLADRPDMAHVAEVGDALGVLRGEHIAVRDGDTWRGLHELRSKTISELLHENPPPRVGSTLARVAALIDPVYAGWMLRRVAELHPDCVGEVVTALAKSLDLSGASAGVLAAFLEGAERADNALYSRATLPILDRERPASTPLETVATMVYSHHNQDVSFDEIGVPQYDRMVRGIRHLADQLPLRSDYADTLRAACSALDAEGVRSVLDSAEPLDAIRVLEAGYPHLRVPAVLVRSLIARVPAPTDVWTATIWSRFVAACIPHLSSAETIETLGPPAVRVSTICAADPSILDAVIQADAASVKVMRLLPLDQEQEPPPLLPWDISRAGAKDALNESTVACLTRLRDACPELQRFEIRTVTGSGEPYRLRDFEPGHKDMLRARFPERFSVRQAVGYQAALRRATSSDTWTELIADQICVAADLAEAAQALPLRFKPHDNARRRAAWHAQLDTVRKRLGGMRPPPIPAGSEPATAHALDDQADRSEDETTRVLRAVLDALDSSCPGNGRKPQPALGSAIALREAADKIDRARIISRTRVQGRGSVLPDDLGEALRRCADLAAALHRRPTLVRLVRAKDPLDSATEIWTTVRDEEQAQAAEVLSGLLAPVPQTTHVLVEDPDPASWGLDSRSWIIMAPLHELDETLALLETLDDSAREQIGPHLVVLCVADDATAAVAEPVSSPGESQRVSLGFGFQLSSRSSASALPLTPDTAREWSRAAGVPILESEASPTEVSLQLVRRSHEAARRRMRRLPDPVTANNGAPSDARAGAPGPVPSQPPDYGSSQFDAAIALLERHVATEEEGTASVYLSEVVLRPATGVPIDSAAQELLGALAVLHLAGLADAAPDDGVVVPGPLEGSGRETQP